MTSSDEAMTDDPFSLPQSELSAEGRVTTASAPQANMPNVLLPIGLMILTFIASTLTWVVIRPIGESRLRYNITDIPGGTGFLWSLVVLALIGCAVLPVRRAIGLAIIGLAVGVIGWLGTIIGLLSSVITRILPSVDVAGLDLSKSQVGQGPGVPIAVLTSLVLGVLAIRALDPVENSSVELVIPVIPAASVVPLFLIGLNHHIEWLTLTSAEVEFRAQIPGDALYGSGLLLVGIWLSMGCWIIAMTLRRRSVLVASSCLSILVGSVCAAYAVLVWVGGKAITWLLPAAIDGWASTQIEPALYVTLFSGFLVMGLGVVGLVPDVGEKSLRLKSTLQTGEKAVSWSNLMGLGLIVVSCVITLVRTLS